MIMNRSGTSCAVLCCALVALSASGLVAVPSAYGQAVTGSGTAGRLTKWTGADTLGNSLIIEAAGKVGIGSSTPAFPLEISGTAPGILGLVNKQGALSRTGGAGVQAFITTVPTSARQRLGFSTFGVRTGGSSYNSAGVHAYSAQPWVLDSARGTYLTFETTAIDSTTKAERMRITANGKVGIGTSTPSSELSVAGVVESTTGGVKFPDGTLQTTAIPPERLQALEVAVGSLQAAVATLQAENQSLRNQVASLQASVASLESNVQGIAKSEVMALDPYVGVTQDGRGPLVRLTGVNLQIVNGGNATETVNGLGNLIVGYDETAPEGSAPECWTDRPRDPRPLSHRETAGFEQPCVAYKTGSHNIVVGSYNAYLSSGGLLAGRFNTLWGQSASITAGEYNSAVDGASVSGGIDNVAMGQYSSVSGGTYNTASGDWAASVSGGISNIASGDGSSVSGGEQNRAAKTAGSVSGGFGNLASGDASFGGWASVSGGAHNVADAPYASISGGEHNLVGGREYVSGASISGGFNNRVEHNYATISGGKDRATTGDYNWVGGGLVEPY
jgi:hypothetical protein